MDEEIVQAPERTHGADRIAHRKAIKSRIISAVYESGISPYALYHLVNDDSADGDLTKGNYNYGLSYPTFLQTCNPSHPNVCNLDACLAIARYLRIPLETLFAPHGEDEQTSASRIITYPSAPFTILSDPKYYGSFHGYMHSLNNNNKARIERFKLDITEHGASMVIRYYSKATNSFDETIYLAGTPIQTKDENVYIVFTNEDGNYIIMSFAYKEYTKRNLYFRHGALLGSGRGLKRNPYVQSFVLFRHPIREDDEVYLPGLLLLSGRDFHVPVSAAEALSTDDPDVDFLFKQLSQHMRKEEYFVIREETLLSCEDSSITEEEILAALLKLKAYATDSKQVYFSHDTPYTRFSLSMKAKPDER